MATVVAFEELLGRLGHGFVVGLLYRDLETRLIEEAERHMDHFVEDLVEGSHLGKDLVDLVEDLEELVVVEASRVVEVDLAHLVVVAEEPNLDLLELLDQPLYLQKDYLGHVRLLVVLEMEHVVEGHLWQVDEKRLLWRRVRDGDAEFHHHIFWMLAKLAFSWMNP